MCIRDSGVIELMGSREELREKGSLTDLYLQILSLIHI